MGIPEAGKPSGAKPAAPASLTQSAEDATVNAYKKLSEANKKFTLVLRSNPTEKALLGAMRDVDDAFNGYVNCLAAIKDFKKLDEVLNRIKNLPL